MATVQYAVEKTKAGLQFVIPGTERKDKTQERKFDFELVEGRRQFVIPGAERISTFESASRLASKPIRPRRGQRSMIGTALFGRERTS